MTNRRISTIRDLNKRRVLEYIVSNQPTSRVAISKLTKLTKATVSAIVSDLLDSGFLLEAQLFESTGGRKPMQIILNKDSFHVVAIDYSRGLIKGALVNLNGDIVSEKVIETSNEKDFFLTLSETYKLIDNLVSKLSAPESFRAVSISIDGSVKKNSNIKLAHAKGWEDININKYITEKYKVKCFTNNEANLAALGENSFFRQIPDLSVISMYAGVGLGTIQDRSLIEGFDGLAGELGHTIVNVNGIPCSCGNNGCIEQYVSVSSVRNKIALIKKRSIKISDIVHLYDSGDSDVISVLNEYSRYLGVLITNTINIVNPNELIIANELLDCIPDLLQKALKFVNLKVSSTNSIRLSSSKNIQLLGASVVAIVDYLSIRYYYPSKHMN
ncbi:MAG: ROK family protein [Acholeplasmataceae bacterium]|nr:ROK family protein [Acholeplasmataceae bacterium]